MATITQRTTRTQQLCGIGADQRPHVAGHLQPATASKGNAMNQPAMRRHPGFCACGSRVLDPLPMCAIATQGAGQATQPRAQRYCPHGS